MNSTIFRELLGHIQPEHPLYPAASQLIQNLTPECHIEISRFEASFKNPEHHDNFKRTYLHRAESLTKRGIFFLGISESIELLFSSNEILKHISFSTVKWKGSMYCDCMFNRIIGLMCVSK